MSDKNQVNLAIERAHAALTAIETMMQQTPTDDRMLALVIRAKTALDQASAALAIARHNAKEAIETL